MTIHIDGLLLALLYGFVIGFAFAAGSWLFSRIIK